MTKTQVLAIHNEPIIAVTIALILNQSGFEAKAAYSGAAGLELARSHGFQVLITEINIYPINQIETAIAITGGSGTV